MFFFSKYIVSGRGKGEIEEVRRKFYNKISLFITRRNINIINRLIENILALKHKRENKNRLSKKDHKIKSSRS